MTTWVYRQTEPRLWTVGFYDPLGAWHSDSDHDVKSVAAYRTAMLNGSGDVPTAMLDEVFEKVCDAVNGSRSRMASAESLIRAQVLREVYGLLTGLSTEEVQEHVYDVLQDRHEKKYLADTEA